VRQKEIAKEKGVSVKGTRRDATKARIASPGLQFEIRGGGEGSIRVTRQNDVEEVATGRES